MNSTPNPITRRITRRRKVAVAAAALAAGVAVVGTIATAQAADASPAARHTVQAAAARTPYVINHYGEENADKGRAERSPKHLVLSEFTSIGGVHWTQWGGKKAVGTGKVTGNWCLDTCLDKPLAATVTLADPKSVHGKKVFTTFTLKLAGKPGAYDAEDLQGKRPLATS